MTPEERQAVEELARSRTAEARLVERAQIILAGADGRRVSAIARDLGVSRPTIYTWITRFNAQGPAALPDQPRSGRPATYPPEPVAEVLAAALTDPRQLGLPFGSWTLDRLRAYLNEQKAIPIKRSDFLEGDVPAAEKVEAFLARALDATGSEAPSTTQALVPWICDALLSNHSVKAYGRDLTDFVRHMRAQGVDPLEVSADHVKCYKRALLEAGMKSGTVARRLSVLRGAYKQLAAKGLIA